MTKKLLPLLLVLVLLMGAFSAQAQEPVKIIWFIGLGTGGLPEHLEPQQAVADTFNASQDAIELELLIVNNDVASDTLATMIAAGEAPDIVGPIGFAGSWGFAGNFLDMAPLAEETGFDLSIWPEEQIAFNTTDEGLIGVPFAVFPNFIFFNRDLFDEAGVPYPPQEFGADYDGSEWNFETMRELAMFMTLDENGNDATMEEFDPEAIVQFGFEFQWMNPMAVGSIFGAGPVVDEDGNATIPETWYDGFNWFYDGMHKDNFIPNESYRGSDLLAAGNAFSSGRVAMATSHLWYTCCIDGDSVPNWDIAVVPSHNGVATSLLHSDTLRILNTTEHPVEAFTVLTYLVTEAAGDLTQTYGAFPFAEEYQEPFFAGLEERFPQGVNWQVVVDSLNYPDVPSHEQNMPNYNKAFDAWGAFGTLIGSDSGLDINAELDRLQGELQAIYDEVDE